MTWREIQKDFPILNQRIGEHRLAYLDNAASSQVPQQVVDRLEEYLTREHSNVHRGVHALSQRATESFDQAREKVASFLNAPSSAQCIFTRGTTEGINLVAHGFGRKFLGKGDTIVVSALEHHANIVPWQMLGEERGVSLRVIPMNDRGELLLEELPDLLDDSVKLVCVNHVSNALGTINDVARVVELAHGRDIPVLIDGAQAVPHMKVDVQELGADFYAFSSHKMCGPTGVGVLYAKKKWLDRMNPFLGGGDMILSVTWEGTTFNEAPHKFEAGTPPIMAAIGLGAAIDYLEGIGLDAIGAREAELLAQATERILEVDGVRLYGTAEEKAGVLSFDVEGVHPHDIGTILDSQGVAIRAGHHCAQPVMNRLGIPATARASFAFYNDEEDIDQLIDGVRLVKEIFG